MAGFPSTAAVAGWRLGVMVHFIRCRRTGPVGRGQASGFRERARPAEPRESPSGLPPTGPSEARCRCALQGDVPPAVRDPYPLRKVVP